MVEKRGATPVIEPPAEPMPQFIVLTRDMFAQGTLGHFYFPQILEGRRRPDSSLLSPVTSIFSKKSAEGLQGSGINTLMELLQLGEDELHIVPIKFHRYISERLRYRMNFLGEQLSITPHARVIAAVFGGEQGAVPPENEEALMREVNEAVSTLPKRQAHIFNMRFGLHDWRVKNLDEVSKLFKTTREIIRQNESNGLGRLRHNPEVKKKLDSLQALSNGAIGRLVGITYLRDIPRLPVAIYKLGLSEETIAELPKRSSFFDSFDSLFEESSYNDYMNVDLSTRIDTFRRFMMLNCADLSGGAKEDIAHRLQQAIRLGVSHEIFEGLLPTVDASVEPQVVTNIPVEELRLSKRAKKELLEAGHGTLESLLDIERNEGNIHEENLTPQVLAEVTSMLRILSFYAGSLA